MVAKESQISPAERATALADLDLARIVTAWPTLPEAVKAGIVAMVRAASCVAARRSTGAGKGDLQFATWWSTTHTGRGGFAQ